jgi:four helix bundle protein
VLDNLNTHISEGLVRYVAEHDGQDQDLLGKKGKKGILKNQKTRLEFLTNPNHSIRFYYTPKHASWMNQIQWWFGVLARKVIRRGNFTSLDDLKSKMIEFIDYFNRTMAKPMKWIYKGKPAPAHQLSTNCPGAVDHACIPSLHRYDCPPRLHHRGALSRKEDRTMMKADEFSERLWDFAANLAVFVETLPDTRVGRHVVGQLLRSGTSSAPNYDEACVAESRRDFAHKVSVAAKEMRESRGWIRFCAKAKLVEWKEIDSLESEADQLLRMLAKSARTARNQGHHQPDDDHPEAANDDS